MITSVFIVELSSHRAEFAAISFSFEIAEVFDLKKRFESL